MFGCICSGRPVQTNLQQIDANEFVFQIEDANKIGHIVVFLLPETILPVGTVANVFCQWSDKPFKMLGFVSNDKQSAIFKIAHSNDAFMTLGISIEQQVHALTPVGPSREVMIVQKILQNAFNYIMSFASPNGTIPVKVFEEWWNRLQNRLQNDPEYVIKMSSD